MPKTIHLISRVGKRYMNVIARTAMAQVVEETGLPPLH
jgi:hypothetical protein